SPWWVRASSSWPIRTGGLPSSNAATGRGGPEHTRAMRFLPYIAKRLLFVIPQLLGIIVVSFALIKAIPGDPAVLMLGPLASEASVEARRAERGLDQPRVVQFWIYLEALLHGDLGTSWQTTRPVFEDLLLRFPATLGLITFGLLGAL